MVAAISLSLTTLTHSQQSPSGFKTKDEFEVYTSLSRGRGTWS